MAQDRNQTSHRVGHDAILLVDGVFLLRPELVAQIGRGIDQDAGGGTFGHRSLDQNRAPPAPIPGAGRSRPVSRRSRCRALPSGAMAACPTRRSGGSAAWPVSAWSATLRIEPTPYFTMPFVEGESLRAKLAREGELPIAEGVAPITVGDDRHQLVQRLIGLRDQEHHHRRPRRRTARGRAATTGKSKAT